MLSQKDAFLSLFSKQPIVSLSETFVLDTETPISVLYRFLDHSYFVLLEGVSEQVKYDRYSYLGLDPYLRLSCVESQCKTIHVDGKIEEKIANFYDFLESVLEKYKLSKDGNVPFNSGIMGYLSYECFSHLETVPVAKKRAMGSPWAEFILPQTVLIFDNLYHSVTIVRNCFTENKTDAVLEYQKALDVIASVKRTILAPLSKPIEPLPNKVDNYDVLTADFNIEKEAFFEKVERCKD